MTTDNQKITSTCGEISSSQRKQNHGTEIDDASFIRWLVNLLLAFACVLPTSLRRRMSLEVAKTLDKIDAEHKAIGDKIASDSVSCEKKHRRLWNAAIKKGDVDGALATVDSWLTEIDRCCQYRSTDKPIRIVPQDETCVSKGE